MHACDQAPCIESCPIEGALYKRDDGLVIIDPVKCTGCRSCVDACPYERVIWFNDDLNIAQKCTGCAHLLDDGWTEPRCADACPTLAIKYLDETEAKELIAKGEVWRPELKDKVKPRVYYLGLPKKFIAGTVYDPKEEEVIIGASVHSQAGRQARPRPSRPTPTATSGSKTWPTAPTTWRSRAAARSRPSPALTLLSPTSTLGDIPLT